MDKKEEETHCKETNTYVCRKTHCRKNALLCDEPKEKNAVQCDVPKEKNALQ
jgi:hypothetical protein